MAFSLSSFPGIYEGLRLAVTFSSLFTLIRVEIDRLSKKQNTIFNTDLRRRTLFSEPGRIKAEVSYNFVQYGKLAGCGKWTHCNREGPVMKG